MRAFTIPSFEGFNETTEEFFKVKETTLQLEHSLISLKTWEQKWHKPFIGSAESKTSKTKEQLIDYIRCMTINKNVDPLVYYVIPQTVMNEISDYIDDPMTATWFSDYNTIGAAKRKGDVITAEIIYYWMIELGVPVEFEKWHLNSLLTLIRVISEMRNKNNKKVNKMSIADRNALNMKRRAQLNSKG